ncbi:MAG TPA: methylmalonyl Co-A mutase-associated GTPase MeaB [Salinivirgaceae bacterium]|nr:methylmalonyl Co-A mutase-associated GTPase MeaB [Salinivirgaceae bacterium]
MEQSSEKFQSALKVNPGVEPPPMVNPEIEKGGRRKRKRILTPEEYFQGIVSGDRIILSMAITMVESSLPEHQEVARQIIEKCLPHSGNSLRIGITGVPGVGKSTFIEALGTEVTHRGRKLAVLAVDPSSERSKGSILGDKTRMEKLTNNPDAFIRPSPSAGSLGGVARKTRETIILVEAAGFNTVFVETVGVGQSEVAVHSMVDFFLLLMLAGAGDELQGIKRGIMEMADLLIINKADGNNLEKARMAQTEYSGALHLFPRKPSGWVPKALTASALYNTGIDQIWENILQYEKLTCDNNYFHQNRQQQSKFWMYETINDTLRQSFYQNPEISQLLADFETLVIQNRLSPFEAANRLLDVYRQNQ